MATQTTPFDRFNDALKSLDDQIQELREQFDGRRKDLEKDLRERASSVRGQLEQSNLYKRAESARRQVEDRVERACVGVYESIGLATKADIDRLSVVIHEGKHGALLNVLFGDLNALRQPGHDCHEGAHTDAYVLIVSSAGTHGQEVAFCGGI